MNSHHWVSSAALHEGHTTYNRATKRDTNASGNIPDCRLAQLTGSHKEVTFQCMVLESELAPSVLDFATNLAAYKKIRRGGMSSSLSEILAGATLHNDTNNYPCRLGKICL